MNDESTPEYDEAPVACSVLVPVLNEEQHIEASVAAMRRQKFPGPLEFLLVDGGSTDRTPEILRDLARQDPRIRILANPRRVTPSALNIALGYARGRWVARMDAHTEYPDDYLLQGVRRLTSGGTRWVSGLQVAKGQGRVSRAVALALRTPLGQGGSRKWAALDGADSEFSLDSGVFAGVWERQTLLEYGGWDEHWARNQDAEMAGRFLAQGEQLILVPAMGAAYVPRNSLSALARQYAGYGRYRVNTAARHPHTMRRSHFLSPAIVAALVAALAGPRGVRRVARVGVGAYAVALATAGVRALGEAEQPGDAAMVPAALAVMHLGHGTGVWRETFRSGPPLAAIASALGLADLAERLAPPPYEVYAPSLREALASRGT